MVVSKAKLKFHGYLLKFALQYKAAAVLLIITGTLKELMLMYNEVSGRFRENSI